jgi:hypothetical protein
MTRPAAVEVLKVRAELHHKFGRPRLIIDHVLTI